MLQIQTGVMVPDIYIYIYRIQTADRARFALACETAVIFMQLLISSYAY